MYNFRNIRLVLLSFASCVTLLAQPKIQITPAITSAQAGATVPLQVALAGSGTTGMVATQFTMAATNGATLSFIPATITGKSAFCDALNLCMVLGVVPAPSGTPLQIQPGSVFNKSALVDGSLLTMNVVVPAGAIPGSIISIAATNIFAVDANGLNVNGVTGPTATITILSPLDLNGDGKVDITDAQIAFSQWVAAKTQANFVLLVKVVSAVAP